MSSSRPTRSGDLLVAEFHDRVRQAAGRDPEPTAEVIDSQSVKGAASVPAASRGFDVGKRVSGRKRHILVDTLGLLLVVMVTAACATDRASGQTLLARLRERHRRITLVWADGGYTGRLVDLARDVLRIALTVVKRSDDTAGFVVLPKRRRLERRIVPSTASPRSNPTGRGAAAGRPQSASRWPTSWRPPRATR